jgi:ubiquinone/menaquinone biosynthesis C-methylase UbiE
MKILNYSNLIDPLLKDLRAFVVKFIGIKEGDRVLDICCGTGDQVFYYAKTGAIVAGIDLNPEMIEMAQNGQKRYGLKDVYFQGADAVDLPFEDSIFDVASISLALHEIEKDKRDKIISEMKRVTKKDGSLIFIDFSVPMPPTVVSYLIKAVEYFAGKNHNENFKNYFQKGGLPILLERNKLKEEKIDYLKDGLLTIIKTKNS